MFLRSWSHFTVRQSQVRVHFHTPAPQLPHFFVFSLADGPVVSLPVWLLKFLSTRLEDAQSFSFCSCEYPEGCCGQHWPCLAATWATPQACWVGLAQEGGRKARAGRWGRGAVKGPAPLSAGRLRANRPSFSPTACVLCARSGSECSCGSSSVSLGYLSLSFLSIPGG